jgi:hypothetical protein
MVGGARDVKWRKMIINNPGDRSVELSVTRFVDIGGRGMCGNPCGMISIISSAQSQSALGSFVLMDASRASG